MNRNETWKKQGGYKTEGLRGNKAGVKMILEQDEKGATTLSPVSKKKEMAKKMSKSDRKTWHKASRKLGKITDGGGRPYSKEEIFKFFKGETRHGRDMSIWREHNN